MRRLRRVLQMLAVLFRSRQHECLETPALPLCVRKGNGLGARGHRNEKSRRLRLAGRVPLPLRREGDGVNREVLIVVERGKGWWVRRALNRQASRRRQVNNLGRGKGRKRWRERNCVVRSAGKYSRGVVGIDQ